MNSDEGALLLPHPFRPMNHIDELRPLLPETYAPIQANGNGNGDQTAYHTKIERPLLEVDRPPSGGPV